jgi:UDP-4-amino-4,6-dideoxy-N-acetyl-beta-L-altrosamine transaminase
MPDFIPYGRQDVTEEDILAVNEVLRSDWLTQGPAVTRFEEAVAGVCRVPHAIAVNSATSALHLACLSLGVGKGDLVWTVPTTFVASANCARYCGADIDFVDIDPGSWCMTPAMLEAKLLACKQSGRPLPKVVIPVHLSGQSCEMEGIAQLASTHGFRIIEDASHAIGAQLGAIPVGSCQFSDIAVFSFHPVKIITSAEGGLATTKSTELAERMRKLRSHGITKQDSDFEYETPGAWYYEQQMLGYNYRLTDVQAALGLSQLKRLSQIVVRRNSLSDRYTAAFDGMDLRVQQASKNGVSSRHLYPIRVESSKRRAVFDGLRSSGIGVNVHYVPVHLQPYYRDMGFEPGQFPEAEAYGEEAISLPLFPTLSESAQDRVIASVKSFLG